MKKKTSASSNIAFIGLMTALNLVFVIIERFLPFGVFFLLLSVPVISSFVALTCKKRYVLVYTIANILLCLFINPQSALYYMMSAMGSGLVFGFSIRYHIHEAWGIILSSLISSIICFITLPIIKFIYGVSLKETFQTLFQISSSKANFYFPMCVSLSSIIQTIISYLIIKSETKKYMLIDKKDNEEHKPLNFIVISVIGLLTSFIIICILWKQLIPFIASVIPFILLISIINLVCFSIYKKVWWHYIVIVLGGLLITAASYSFITYPYSLLTLISFPILTNSIIFIVSLIDKSNKTKLGKVNNNGNSN
ncbi:MAG: hypothetical protein HUJ61_05735 [Bacilli bacterium]|nr:hypothetical protein [Bacilli bacterium]